MTVISVRGRLTRWGASAKGSNLGIMIRGQVGTTTLVAIAYTGEQDMGVRF